MRNMPEADCDSAASTVVTVVEVCNIWESHFACGRRCGHRCGDCRCTGACARKSSLGWRRGGAEAGKGVGCRCAGCHEMCMVLYGVDVPNLFGIQSRTAPARSVGGVGIDSDGVGVMDIDVHRNLHTFVGFHSSCRSVHLLMALLIFRCLFTPKVRFVKSRLFKFMLVETYVSGHHVQNTLDIVSRRAKFNTAM